MNNNILCFIIELCAIFLQDNGCHFIEKKCHLQTRQQLFKAGPKTWVCARIVMNCNGETCTTTTCFDAYTPCI